MRPGLFFVRVAKVLPRSGQPAPKHRRDILAAGGNDMEKVINCPCGFVLKGASDEEVVQKAQAHAKQVHQMDLSKEQALAMAKPA
jgi:predicted small metal-binding protein